MVEYIVAVGIATKENVTVAYRVSGNKILMNEGVNMTRTSINIFHHFSGTTNDTEIISKQFLGPTTELVDATSVFQYFFDCVAIANPIEYFPPKVTTITSNTPVTTSNIAYKKVIMHFIR